MATVVTYCKTCLPAKVVLEWGASAGPNKIAHDTSGSAHTTGSFTVEDNETWNDSVEFVVATYPDRFTA